MPGERAADYTLVSQRRFDSLESAFRQHRVSVQEDQNGPGRSLRTQVHLGRALAKSGDDERGSVEQCKLRRFFGRTGGYNDNFAFAGRLGCCN